MAFNNTYNINTVLHEHKHQQDENETDWLKELSMDDAIEELAFLYYKPVITYLRVESSVSSTTTKKTNIYIYIYMCVCLIVMEESSNNLIWVDD